MGLSLDQYQAALNAAILEGEGFGSINAGGDTGAAKTIPDVTVNVLHTYTITANCTFTMPAPAAGRTVKVLLTQDGTGSRVPTFTGVRWAGGSMPAASTAAAAVDLFTFQCVDGTHWEGNLSIKALA